MDPPKLNECLNNEWINEWIMNVLQLNAPSDNFFFRKAFKQI